MNDAIPPTEHELPASRALDRKSPSEIVRILAEQDAGVPQAVARAGPLLARAIEEVARRMGRGGRLVYLGAGTSGRLGVLDAVECPPTFGTDPHQVLGVVAGGPAALLEAIEGAEDDERDAERVVADLALGGDDVAVGISASGRTPWTVRAVAAARARGAWTLALVCARGSALAREAHLAIEIPVGPEVLAGSTRLKAGTATKLALNTLSTGAMVLMGRCAGNRMAALRATNSKLRARATRILGELAGLDPESARGLLERCDGDLWRALSLAGRGPEAGPPTGGTVAQG